MGSGGTLGKHGVGFLLHKKWAQAFLLFRAVSERLGLLRLRVGGKIVSLICVYMPHCGYPDIEVEGMYDQISQITGKERALGHQVVIGGDWNAEVASSNWDQKHHPVGAYGNQLSNARGL
eukprot:10356361-Karenia_brevis.AAC.1